MMHLEYNWTACRYQPRFGDTFTDVRGERGWDTLDEARAALAAAGLKLGRKTASRSWTIESIDPPCAYCGEETTQGDCGDPQCEANTR